MTDDFMRAGVARPCVEIDFAGACLTQPGLDTLYELMSSAARDYETVDIKLLRVSRQSIPKLTANFEEKYGRS